MTEVVITTSRVLSKLALASSLALALSGCAKNGAYVWVSEVPRETSAGNDYVIAQGDTVSVRVFGQDNLTTRAKVRSDGKIAVPFLGDVDVGGKTPAGMSRDLEARYKDYMVSPKVTVSVDETQATAVSVVGEVTHPGSFPVDAQTGVLQALALAGGLTEYASRDAIYVLRKSPHQRVRFTYAALIHGDEPSTAFRLRTGDIVVVELGMLSALPVAADLMGTLTLSDRMEVRVRSPGTSPNAPSLDAEMTPEARLTVASRRLRLSLAYLPRLTAWDLNNQGIKPLLLHGASVSAGWREHTTELTLREDAAYGGMGFAALTALPGASGASSSSSPRLDVIPTAGTIQYASSTTTFGSRTELRRLTLATHVGYQMSGGADAESRASIPWQRGPLADASAEVAVTRKDRAVTTVSGVLSSFTSGSEILLLEETEGLRHRFASSTDGELLAGVSEARTRPFSTAAFDHTTYPVAEASLEHRIPFAEDRFLVRATLRVGPVVNRLLGLVDERVQARFEGRWSNWPYGARLTLSAAQSVPAGDLTAITLGQGEVSFQYNLSEAVTIDLGVRELAQRQAQLGLGLTTTDPQRLTFTQTVAFVGITIRAPETRL